MKQKFEKAAEGKSNIFYLGEPLRTWQSPLKTVVFTFQSHCTVLLEVISENVPSDGNSTVRVCT